MNKFFRLLFLIFLIFSFIFTPLNIVFAEELFRAPVIGEHTITNGPGEQWHTGVSEYAIDISTAGEKIDIYSVADGVVEIAGVQVKDTEGKKSIVDYGSNLKDLKIVDFGNYIIIRHDNGYKSLYAHLSEIDVKKDESVTKGEKIGKSGNTGFTSGSTGMHLHFEIRKDKQSVDLIGLMENFKRDNFNKKYLDWRDGKVDTLPSGPSGYIIGSPIEAEVSNKTVTSNQTSAQESIGETKFSLFDKIVDFFKRVVEFFSRLNPFSQAQVSQAIEDEEVLRLEESKEDLTEIEKKQKEVSDYKKRFDEYNTFYDEMVNIMEKHNEINNSAVLKIGNIIGDEQMPYIKIIIDNYQKEFEELSNIKVPDCAKELYNHYLKYLTQMRLAYPHLMDSNPSGYNKAVAKAEAELAEANKAVAKPGAELAEYDKAVAKFEAELAEANKAVAKFEAELAEYNKAVAKADAELAEYNKEVERIWNDFYKEAEELGLTEYFRK